MMRILYSFLLLFCFACADKVAEQTAPLKTVSPAPAPKYFFYPKANVYFDSANKEYIFLANDGKTWQTEKGIPAAMQVLMDRRIFIEAPPTPVWRDNERHRLIYSALLYASPADTQRIKPVVKPVVKSPEPKPAEVAKKKSVFKRVWDKIFGRKKKDTAGH